MRGTLSVHASQTIASYWLPQRLMAFRAAYPGIALTLTLGNTRTVAQAVIGGEADLGFVEGELDEPALAAIPVDEDQLTILWLPPTHGHPAARSCLRCWRARTGSCARKVPAHALCSRRRCRRWMSLLRPCRSPWFCPPTNRSCRRSPAGSARPRSRAWQPEATSMPHLVAIDLPLGRQDLFCRFITRERHRSRAALELARLCGVH